MPRKLTRRRQRSRGFDVTTFLSSAAVPKRIGLYEAGAVVYAQGDPATTVMYVQEGRVKLSIVSSAGKEAVLGVMGAGDFFGEGCLAGQTVRMGTATAMIKTRVLKIDRDRMLRLLHRQPELSDRFIGYVLSRNIRIEEDLVDRLFNSVEKRFARALLLMARYGKARGDEWVLPKVSQETLAEMVGTTRPRINFFMNRFRSLGFIDYNGDLIVRTSLLGVVLLD